jgi:hypothetical protein
MSKTDPARRTGEKVDQHWAGRLAKTHSTKQRAHLEWDRLTSAVSKFDPEVQVEVWQKVADRIAALRDHITKK